jgi:hypothetical protein
MLIHVTRWFSNPDIILIFTVISIFMREIMNDSGGNNVPKNCSFQKPSRNRIGLKVTKFGGTNKQITNEH